MMKTFIFTILVALIAGTGIAQNQKPLPDFSFTNSETGEAFTRNKLEKSKPVIVMYFDPYCEHCMQQTEWIVNQIDDFRDIQMMYVSNTADVTDIKAFKDKYFGEKKKDVYFLKDEQFKFDGYFGYSEVPSIYIFNRNWLQVKEFHNEVEAALLLRFAR